MRKLPMLDRRRLTIAGIVLAVILFVALNTFGSLALRGERLDLTDNRQFTLSPGTLQLLAKIDEPITLRFYASRALRDANPFLGSYADRVHDMLHTYADAARGRITVEYIDPEPFSTEEDRAVGFGLDSIPLEGGASSGYLGIAGTNSTDDVDVLPVLAPEREAFLEYDLTRLVNNLAHPDKPVVALLSSLPVNGDPALQDRPWTVMQELGQFFDVRVLGGEIDKIADDVQALMLVHPQGLSEKTLYAIDQFVLRGGKALVFVDPDSEAEAMRQSQSGMPAETSSNLDKLFQAWGVDYSPDIIVGDPQAARQVSYPSGGREQIVDYLPWLSLDRTRLAADDVITAELNRVNLATAGALAPHAGASTSFVPLIRSSGDAMPIEADKVRMFPDPLALLRDYKAGGKELVMAAHVSGPVKSAFGDKPPEGVDATGQLTESAGPAQLVIVADTDLLDDRNWLSNQNMMGQQVDGPAGRQCQSRGQRAGLSRRQRCADGPARPRGHGAAVHDRGRDPARERERVPGQGAGAAAAAGRAAGQAEFAQGLRERGHQPARRCPAQGDRGLPDPAARYQARVARRAAGVAQGHRAAARPDPAVEHRRRAGSGGGAGDRRGRGPARSAIAAASTKRTPEQRGRPMSPKSFAVLAGATALSLGLAAWAVVDRDVPVVAAPASQALFPGLLDHVNDVREPSSW